MARRREGASVGVLLGLLSLAVAHVVGKEIWLQWLASTDDPARWSWLVAVFGLLLLHFPDGRVPSARWRWVPMTMVVAAVLNPGRRGGRGHAVPGAAGRPGPAAALAVPRHDLYDVDKTLGLAVTWGLVTALLLGVYAGVSSTVVVLIGRDSAVGVAVGTAVATLLLLPALRGVRSTPGSIRSAGRPSLPSTACTAT